MTGPLDGIHALVTGGGSGIGAAIARTLAGAGASVSLAGRRPEPLHGVADALANATAFPADVTDPGAVQAMVAAARAAYGPIDILIANAGAAESAPFSSTGLDRWQRMIDVNLTGAFLSAHAVLGDITRKPTGSPAIRRIVFVASTAGLKGYPYVAAYVAAKHGVVGLMRALAIECAATPATVNAVCPGFTETPLLDASIATIATKTGVAPEAARARLAASNPQGRLIRPEEVAATVLWLCSQDAGSITGQAISISGGEA
jgi:NAD(P)-dependent dehydrogenase (short-subunit alcohol dehydrogenase family)